MTVLIVLLVFVGFLILDVLVRTVARRLQERRLHAERKAALETPVRLEFAKAQTLQRVELPDAQAAILAIDDEPVVLDSLRKVLVLEGYSIDTVESGPEALELLQQRDYDFVFTDLKMPGMDGVEVVKAVHHLRPDTDIAVITGFATIESAVETMQHGAVAYVQKPFTPEELADFTKTLLFKREARIESHHRPSVRVVSPAMVEEAAAREYCVPGGTFLSDGHVWARLEQDGRVRVGLDDFSRKALGAIDGVELPEEGAELSRGDVLFTVRRGSHEAHFVTPVSGRVTWLNRSLDKRPATLGESPYDLGWVCILEPSDLAEELPALRIGRPVIDWYHGEIDRLCAAGGPAEDGAPAVDWKTFEQRFLKPAA